ncbi:MAG TPA: hypothetical protein PKD28_01355 [Candidatus Saccharibacteria bacterium]|nr:hypothetical protein [Candidatus Saccharibacteria bacterium]
MVNPLDRIKQHQAENARAASSERNEKSLEAIHEFYEASHRYAEYVSENDYQGLDILAFDSTLGQEEYAGKTFVFGGTIPAPSSVAIVFQEDGSHQLLNDSGAGGVISLPIGSKLPTGVTLNYPVSVLPVDQGEEALFGNPLESGLRRGRWIAFDEATFLANNTPSTIENVTKLIDRDLIRIKALVESDS